MVTARIWAACFNFVLSLDVAYRFDNGHRVGVRAAHISNGGANEQNPGEEELFLTYSIPLGPYLGRDSRGSPGLTTWDAASAYDTRR